MAIEHATVVHPNDIMAEIRTAERGIDKFNRAVGELITTAVATMWCAYIFAVIALISLPQAIHDSFATGFRPLPIITWVAQTFLQLVLLAVILYGQNLQSVRADSRSEATFRNTKNADKRLTTILEGIEARGEENARMEAQNSDILKALEART